MRQFIFLAASAVLCLLLPGRLIAGGPACLSVPVEGVTADNAPACGELLSVKLADHLASGSPRVELRQQGNQWYLTCYLGKDVSLSDISAALKGSPFSVPRDKLHFFGHVALEIDAGKAAPKKLLADLTTLEHVSIAASDPKDGHLSVTVDMPYPAEDGKPRGKYVGWQTFQRSELSSDPATKSESPTTAAGLPGYHQFRDLVASHGAKLTDVRWSTHYACRAVGCVVAQDAKVAAAD